MNSAAPKKLDIQTDPEGRPFMPIIRPAHRPSVLDQLDLTLEDIVAAYKAEKSIAKAAERLGIAVNTCKKYLHIAQVQITGHHPTQPLPWRKREATPVHTWFKAHRDDQLPRSCSEIAALSGFTPGQIKKFLYGRKAAAESYLKSLGDLRERDGAGFDMLGHKIPYGAISDYTLKIDIYDLTVRVSAMLRFGGQVHMLLTFRQYQKLFS